MEPFPVYLVEPLVARLHPPEGAFDPAGAWRQRWAASSVDDNPIPLGTLEMIRSPAGNGGFRLSLKYEKILDDGHTGRLTAELECLADALSTPKAWEFTSCTFDPEGVPIEDTRVGKRAKIEAGAVELWTGGKGRRETAPERYTSEWSLFDAVQRLPREAGLVHRFSLLDDFDRFKGEHELWYSGPAEIPVASAAPPGAGGRTVKTHTFQHTGRGISPTKYWTAENGRLLFMVAGMEAYVLESAGE